MPAIQIIAPSNTETAAGVEKQAVKTPKLQGIKSAFSNYMQQNSSNTAQAAKQQDVMPQETARAQTADGTVRQQYEQYQNKSAAQADKVSSAAEQSGTDPEAVNEAVNEAAAEIKEIIKENLGVDDEQIEAAMELLGLTQADLLDVKQLTALSVTLTGSEDAGMMLFHQDFQNVLQQAGAVTEELLNNLGITMEELTAQAESMQDAVKQLTQDVSLQTQEEPIEGLEQAPQILTEDIQPQQEVQAEAETDQSVQVRSEVQPQQEAQAQTAVNPQEEQTQPQEQARPQEAQQVQKVQNDSPQEEQARPQTQKDESAMDNMWDTDTGSQKMQEDGRFDFTLGVQQHNSEISAPQPQNVTNQAPLPQIDLQDVIHQIAEHTRIHLSEDVKSIEMQLNPENLGKVYLHVSEKQGAVTAQIMAQNENIKEALVQQAAILKENLNQQGIKVDAVEVSVGTHEFESNLERDARGQEEQARQQEEQNRRNSRRNLNLNELDDLGGLSGLMSEEEMLAAQIMRDNGNNVDYKA